MEAGIASEVERQEQEAPSTSAAAMASDDTFSAPSRVRRRKISRKPQPALEDWTNIPSYLKDNEWASFQNCIQLKAMKILSLLACESIV